MLHARTNSNNNVASFSQASARKAARRSARRDARLGRAVRAAVESLETRRLMTYTVTDLANLTNTTGAEAEGGLYMDSSGNIYGTASIDGQNSDGGIFKVAAGSTHTLTSFASFNGTNGSTPKGGLIADSSGNLYGTTSGGGAHNYGTVFEIQHGTSTITTIASFNGTNGDSPTGDLLIDSSGNLYGTTQFGGANSKGEVYEIANNSTSITVLASFNGTNGQFPAYAGVVMDSSGNLYGTAYIGAANGVGDIWKIASGSGTITDLADFSSTVNGAYPYGTLAMDSSGNLYGATAGFGAGTYPDGTIFKVASTGGAIDTLASFSASVSGQYSQGGVLLDSSGDIFADSYYGSGAANYGAVVELPHGASSLTVLTDLNVTTGDTPQATR